MVDTRVGWDYSATGPLAGVWLILGLGLRSPSRSVVDTRVVHSITCHKRSNSQVIFRGVQLTSISKSLS